VSQLPISPDCVFDASLVPGTCLERFSDFKGLINKFLESPLLRKWPLSYSFFKGALGPLPSVPVWAEPSQLLIVMWKPCGSSSAL
jgi:hypothetical protein